METFIGNYCFQLSVKARKVEEAYDKLEIKLATFVTSKKGQKILALLEPDLE